jgi:transposase
VEILGRERRRRWSNAERLEIIAAVGVNGETLARVARRYDVSRSQIYQWRHQFRKQGLLPAPTEPTGPTGPTFLPVDIGASMLSAEPVPDDGAVPPLMVELCLAQERRLRFGSGIEAAALTRLIRSVEAA